ncbi:MAG TPA: transglutaminase-like domain-containing protein [Caulobacteraceae bacterium]|jgi:transglutaminase-like putative cysteine protease
MRPIPASDATRTVGEARIVELLLLQGWAFEARGAARPAAEAEARAALLRLVSADLPSRVLNGARGFDPSEVVCALAAAVATGSDPALAERRLASGRGLAWQPTGWATNLAAPPPLDHRPRRFRVTIERRFSVAAPGRRLRLGLPAPIEDERLRISASRAWVSEAADCRVRADGIDAVLEAPSGAAVSLQAMFEFEARAWLPTTPESPLSPADVDLYTRLDEGLIKVSPRVAAFASDGPAGETARDLVRRVWDVLMSRMACGQVRYEDLHPRAPLDWVLEHGWFDCQLGAALIAAVCRARGVPARLVGGYTLATAAPFQHYWVEVWLTGQGWTPFDLWGWDLAGGDSRSPWRDAFYGQLDVRMTTQRLPRRFSNPGVRLPRAWRLLPRATSDGVETEFMDAETGALVYAERVAVEPLS